jgi:tRNA nucleotidyltransferase (CCA-adding enzyme)
MKAQEPKRLQEKLETINEVEKIFEEIKKSGPALSVKDLEIDGNDLIKLGLSPGPQIGNILNKLLEAVINDPSKNRKETLIELAKQLINGHSED